LRWDWPEESSVGPDDDIFADSYGGLRRV